MPATQSVSITSAIPSVAQSVIRFGILLIRGRIHQPTRHVGGLLAFENGAAARVFRETVVDRPRPEAPAVLVVEFRLRGVHGWLHRLFRMQSVLNTPLFAGFPGFVTKLWLTQDENDVYRGIYEWDGIEPAESYAGVLCWLLTPIAVPGSVDYRILPDEGRARFVAEPECLTGSAPMPSAAWWRPA